MALLLKLVVGLSKYFLNMSFIGISFKRSQTPSVIQDCSCKQLLSLTLLRLSFFRPGPECWFSLSSVSVGLVIFLNMAAALSASGEAYLGEPGRSELEMLAKWLGVRLGLILRVVFLVNGLDKLLALLLKKLDTGFLAESS